MTPRSPSAYVMTRPRVKSHHRPGARPSFHEVVADGSNNHGNVPPPLRVRLVGAADGDYTWGLSSVAFVRGELKKTDIMAKQCEICGKSPVVGRQVSHAHNVSARRFEPNLQTVRASVNGGTKRLRVCTRCLRSGKVVKAA